MRTRRLLGSLLTVALAGSSIALIAPPAQAAELPTKVKMSVSHPKAHVGTKVSISGNVIAKDVDGEWKTIPTDAGGVTLQAKTKGSKKWKSLETDTSGSSFYFSSLKLKKTTTYRVVYDGGAGAGHTFPAATGKKKSKAYRDLNDKLQRPGNRIMLVGKIAKYKKKKVVVQQRTKPKGKWRVYRTVKTNKKGRFSVRLAVPRRGNLYYRAFTPASGGIEKSMSNYSYRTYRL